MHPDEPEQTYERIRQLEDALEDAARLIEHLSGYPPDHLYWALLGGRTGRRCGRCDDEETFFERRERWRSKVQQSK